MNVTTWKSSALRAARVERPVDVRRARSFDQDHAVGHSSGECERFLLLHAGDDGGIDRRRLVQPNGVEMYLTPVERDLVAGEQPFHDGDRLVERRQRRWRAGPHLPIHSWTPVPDPGEETAGRDVGERGDLHRGDRRVPGDRRQDADTDVELVGHRQRGGRKADTGRVEAVLDDPELIDTRRFEPPRGTRRRHLPGTSGRSTSRSLPGGHSCPKVPQPVSPTAPRRVRASAPPAR